MPQLVLRFLWKNIKIMLNGWWLDGVKWSVSRLFGTAISYQKTTEYSQEVKLFHFGFQNDIVFFFNFKNMKVIGYNKKN